MNTPYIKQYNKDGFLLNPITQDKPFVNASPYSARGKSAPYKRFNNRKATAGRKFLHKPIEKILGYTVKAALIDKDGIKMNVVFKNFIEVADPNYKNDRKLSTRQNVKKRFDSWMTQIHLARKAADDLFLSQKFPCIITAKFQKTSIPIQQW